MRQMNAWRAYMLSAAVVLGILAVVLLFAGLFIYSPVLTAVLVLVGVLVFLTVMGGKAIQEHFGPGDGGGR